MKKNNQIIVFDLFSGVSHSAMTDMQTIQQEGVTTTRNVSLAPRNRDFLDDYEPAGFSSRSKYVFRLINRYKIPFVL
jgi:hypothetical protein